MPDENSGGLGLVAGMGVAYTEGGETEGRAKSGPVVDVLVKLSGSGSGIEVGVAMWEWPVSE